MATRTRARTEPTIQDLVGGDPRVVAVDSFHPLGSQLIERGRFYRLSDPAVRSWPERFSICIPVTIYLGMQPPDPAEISRDAAA